MTYEVEQKYRVDSLESVRARLNELGASAWRDIRQTDCYFAHPSRDFAKTDEALRLRRVGSRNFITYKGPRIDKTTKTRHEIEFPLPEGDQGYEESASLLKALGFTPVTEVKKRRRTAFVAWRDRQIEAALDEVDEVGDFVELELLAETEQIDAAKADLSHLARALQLSGAEQRSYLQMLLEARGA